ncbi:MAG: flagellar motor switch protein FliG [Gammaproteobacteria bacterium]|jgi:flagellar motor switch protein FliG
MSDPAQEFSGPDQAAILLMALGTERAAEVLKHMEPKQVQIVGSAMGVLSDVTQSQLGEVLKSFIGTVRDLSSLSVGSEDYLRNMLHQALGPERASSVLPRIVAPKRSKGLDSLQWMDPEAIAEVLVKEHPQIIALAMINLDPEMAGQVLSFLPDEIGGDVMLRVATLDGVHPSALKELDAILEGQLGGNIDMKVSGLGGVKVAAEILNTVASDLGSQVLERINEADTDLKIEIQDQMFDFESLNNLDDRGLQTVLREISSETLVLALKGASPRIRERILTNMSGRAAEMLRDDLEDKGPVRLSEVETAQKEILLVVDRLVEEGTVIMQGKGEDFV